MKLTAIEYMVLWYLYNSKTDTFWATQFCTSTMMGCTVTDQHKIAELRKKIDEQVVSDFLSSVSCAKG